jgi:hypothetical protein
MPEGNDKVVPHFSQLPECREEFRNIAGSLEELKDGQYEIKVALLGDLKTGQPGMSQRLAGLEEKGSHGTVSRVESLEATRKFWSKLAWVSAGAIFLPIAYSVWNYFTVHWKP